MDHLNPGWLAAHARVRPALHADLEFLAERCRALVFAELNNKRLCRGALLRTNQRITTLDRRRQQFDPGYAKCA
jgi:hypothetical protein